jgi:hypothetical protein
MTAKSKKQDLSNFPVAQIKVAKENDILYDRFGSANEDDQALLASIKKHGVQEPLTISSDNFLLSGHRRLAASKRLQLEFVPVRQQDVVFELLKTEERLEMLRLHNQQRNKTPNERIREKLLDIDPKKARSDLILKRAKDYIKKDENSIRVSLGKEKKRPRITTIKFLNAVVDLIWENEEYWPLTDRRVHYLLLNDPPLRHDKKPNSKYENDVSSYKALTNLLIRARLSGQVPLEAIEDPTRPIQQGGGFDSLEEFIGQEMNNFLMGYSRNLMMGQSVHIEIMLEKNALRSVVERVAREYCIPVTTGRGFSSLSPRHELQQRYFRSGKDRLILLMLTDFDPDGEQIAVSFARSLRDDLGVSNIHAVKVALNAQDVIKYNLPSDMDAKPTSPNYEKFFMAHGSKAVELDAIPVKTLEQMLRDSIESYLDMDGFNAQISLEAEDAAHIQAYREITFESIAPPPAT